MPNSLNSHPIGRKFSFLISWYVLISRISWYVLISQISSYVLISDILVCPNISDILVLFDSSDILISLDIWDILVHFLAEYLPVWWTPGASYPAPRSFRLNPQYRPSWWSDWGCFCVGSHFHPPHLMRRSPSPHSGDEGRPRQSCDILHMTPVYIVTQTNFFIGRDVRDMWYVIL